jgi:predicted RNase H-like HicB family nuclease
MSNTKREPLLSNADLGYVKDTHTCEQVRDTYEAARAKDAELIQMLVDDLRILRIEFGNRVGQTTEIGIASLSDAEAAGFKPSDSTN